EIMRTQIPWIQDRNGARPSYSCILRCTTTKISCTKSSRSEDETPWRRRIRRTNGACSSKLARKLGEAGGCHPPVSKEATIVGYEWLGEAILIMDWVNGHRFDNFELFSIVAASKPSGGYDSLAAVGLDDRLGAASHRGAVAEHASPELLDDAVGENAEV